MSAYQHGEYVPELGGWYDAGLKGCVDSPGKVTPMRDTTSRTPRPLAGAEFRSDAISTAELRSRGNAAAFRPNMQMEQLRRLRDSEMPEQRQQFDQLVAGQQRISLGSYEGNLRDYLAAGNELPEGVAAPKEG